MIAPPRKGELYPGRLPSVWQQWSRISALGRVLLVAGPLVVVLLVFLASVRAGVTALVLVVGAALVTVVFVKNRTDRHNAGVDRGEIRVAADPDFRAVPPDDLPPDLVAFLESVGLERSDLGRVLRFDGGWIARRRNPRDVAVLAGDDGGFARFDPRVVTDLWAVSEYRAGRGRD